MDLFNPRSVIIYRPDLQSRWQRYLYRSLAVIGWVIWFYLWVPLLTLAAWTAGGITVHSTMFEQGGLWDFYEFLRRTSELIFVLCGGLILWALYNHYRFRCRERRQPRPPVTLAAIADYAGLPEQTLRAAQGMRRAVVLHDAAGRIAAIQQAWVGDRKQEHTAAA
ncbi:MAG TPA: poly-beta-1,6-N-acetyl-D-glucosamine biosynthesis protein PgaD [Candidatus Competibacteraceae bacterium]|nr:poly-beta-1,6-N-acetyl-D-glucosamine biosynthesis protein PgaD [Candidatus Competibacteraceae bacterium]